MVLYAREHTLKGKMLNKPKEMNASNTRVPPAHP
jgi:hypothetical protein